MSCNRYKTNAPIVCEDALVALKCAQKRGLQLTFAEIEGSVEGQQEFINTIVGASQTGLWCVVDASNDTATCDALREAVYRVWLKGSWDHHDNFRMWIVQPKASQASDVASLPFLIAAAAVTLKYTGDFDDEFLARELVSAVEDSHYYRIVDTKEHVRHLSESDVVRLFAKARNEDDFIAIVADNTPENVAHIVRARDASGVSVLDVAIKREFINAAVLLRDAGCRSEVFDFAILLQPSFRSMLGSLLDPWKPFPFDSIAAASKVALSGKVEVLRKLFDSRVDVDFTFAEYPLVEACATNNMDVVYAVIDRMGATGVHPLRDSVIASHFLVKLLTWRPPRERAQSTYLPAVAVVTATSDGSNPELADTRRSSVASSSSVLTGARRRSSTNIKEVLNEAQLTTANWLADACIFDGVRFAIPLAGVTRAELYPDLLQKVLRCIDVEAATDTEMLLEFFIHFDPQNELARRIVIRAVNDIAAAKVAGTLDEPAEDALFQLVAQMLRKGPVASPMARWALERATFLTLLPLTYRMEDMTLLMVALLCPPNIPSIRAILEVNPAQTKLNMVNQIDRYQNNALKKLVLEVSKDPEEFADYLVEYGDAVELLLAHGADFVVRPPAFQAPLFTLCARQDLGEMCYELLNTRPVKGSVILGCSFNALALMWRRFRRKQRSSVAEAKHSAAQQQQQQPPPETEAVAECQKQPVDEMMEKFKIPPPDVPPPVTEIDPRIAKAREPHPTFGPGFLAIVDLEVLAHIAAFAATPKDVATLSAVCVTWLHATLFDEVWAHRRDVASISDANGGAGGLWGGDSARDERRHSTAVAVPVTDCLRSARSYYIEAVVVNKRLRQDKLL